MIGRKLLTMIKFIKIITLSEVLKHVSLELIVCFCHILSTARNLFQTIGFFAPSVHLKPI